MSTYVIGDVHGYYTELKELLSKINFKDTDTLYLLGDLIDRGNSSVDVVNFVKESKNVFSVKGNHEWLFEDAMEGNSSFFWLRSGGKSTINEVRVRYPDEDKLTEMYEYVKEMPLYLVIGKYILIHAALYMPNNQNDFSLEEILAMQDEHYCLQDRSHIGNERQYRDYTVICGHSITSRYFADNTGNIQKSKGHIYMDCGIIGVGGRLGCLRLDDMAEFYVDRKY